MEGEIGEFEGISVSRLKTGGNREEAALRDGRGAKDAGS